MWLAVLCFLLLVLGGVTIRFNGSWHVYTHMGLTGLMVLTDFRMHSSPQKYSLLIVIALLVIALAMIHLSSHRQPDITPENQRISNYLDASVIGVAISIILLCGYRYNEYAHEIDFHEPIKRSLQSYPDRSYRTDPSHRLYRTNRSYPSHRSYQPNHETQQKIIQLRQCYREQYAFPDWVLQYDSHDFDRTRVFYPHTARLNEVVDLVSKREPTNIENPTNPQYDANLLEQFFGYRRGIYHQDSPNIAVYTYATVRDENRNRECKVHLLHLIGCALDSPRQPDYRKYVFDLTSCLHSQPLETCLKQNIQKTREIRENLNELKNFYKRMWTYLPECVRLLAREGVNIQNVKFSNVGGGVFAGSLQGEIFNEQILEPIFSTVRSELLTHGVHVEGGEVHGDTVTVPDRIPQDVWAEFDAGGQERLERILFLNAWDPWSILGNGNKGDNSLDGYWGRYSNISVLALPYINTMMNHVDRVYIPCEVDQKRSN